MGTRKGNNIKIHVAIVLGYLVLTLCLQFLVLVSVRSPLPVPDSLAQAFGEAFLTLFVIVGSWIVVIVSLIFVRKRYGLPAVDVVVFSIIYPLIYLFYAGPVSNELFSSHRYQPAVQLEQKTGGAKRAGEECSNYKNDQRRTCYWNAALNARDISLCYQIDKDLIRNLCIKDLKEKFK